MKLLKNSRVGIRVGILAITGIASGFLSCDISTKKVIPNFIIILTDDQGYNDLGCFGSTTIKTPNIDRMAQEGLMLTSFYAQPVCGPSRGALMTGRYPLRIGGGWRVNHEEIMLSEVLKKKGYATGCIGKWDMSGRKYQDGLVPNDQGFDYYFGTIGDGGEIYRNREIVHKDYDRSILTGLYTDAAIEFIKNNKDVPFFLYLAHNMPHIIIDASPQFKGNSEGELYGDVIEEIDWNVGRIIDFIKELELDNSTYILFASDNGPWSQEEEVIRMRHEGQLATGSSKPLRSAKGSPYEGGFRVPCIFWAPGKIPAGSVSNEIMSTLDILPTFAKLAGARIPEDRIIDGFDQSGFIFGKKDHSTREFFHYHIKGELHAIRQGKWKLLLPNTSLSYDYADDSPTVHELYNLEDDISEKNNLADEYPKIVDHLIELAKKAPNAPDPQSY